MAKTNFQDIYIDNNGKIYYEVKNRPHFIVAKSNIVQAEKDKIG